VSSAEGDFSRVLLELRSLTASVLNTIGIIEKNQLGNEFYRNKLPATGSRANLVCRRKQGMVAMYANSQMEYHDR
jgi:hypothetical protein